MNLLKKLIKNNLVLLSSSIFEKIVFFFLTIFIARILGVEDYGKWGFVLSFTSLFVIFTDIGLNRFLVRDISRNKKKIKIYLTNILAIKFILSLTTFIIIIFISNLINISKDQILAVYLIAFSFLFSSIAGAFSSIFIAYEKMEFNALSKIIHVALLGISYVLVLLLDYGIIGLAVATLFVNLASLIYNFIILKKYFFKKIFNRIRFNLWKNLIKNAIPFGLITVFSIIYFKIDIVMVSLIFKDDSAVGLYNAASRLIFNLMFLPIILPQTLFPIMSRYFKKSSK